METAQWSLTKILNRAIVEMQPKIFGYNKMDCINSKPAIQVGNENLQEYKLTLKLYHSFCNPKKIIETIENQAALKEPFDWVYNKEYKGKFVINEIEYISIKQINDSIFYAELTINLLEVPAQDEYKEQLDDSVNLDLYEQYSESSNKTREFLSSVKNSIKENLKNSISTDMLISGNLSEAAKEILENVRLEVLSDISSNNYANIFNNISQAIKNIKNSSLDISDIQNLENIISTIPKLILDASLRKGA